MLLAYNPAYQDLVARFEATIRGWSLPPGGTIIDVGAGTGNFSLRWARSFPGSPVVHVDLDPGMNAEADRKARAAGIANLRVLTCSIEDASFAPGGAAAVSSVHALYTFPRPQATLARLYDWLAPGGRAFFCDPGRPLDMRDWTRYFAGHLMRTLGPARTAQVFWRGREIIRQNRAIRRAQIDGRYWTHSPAAFRAAVEAAGFEVEHADTCFRGYSDLVVARRPSGDRGATSGRGRGLKAAKQKDACRRRRLSTESVGRVEPKAKADVIPIGGMIGRAVRAMRAVIRRAVPTAARGSEDAGRTFGLFASIKAVVGVGAKPA